MLKGNVEVSRRVGNLSFLTRPPLTKQKVSQNISRLFVSRAADRSAQMTQAQKSRNHLRPRNNHSISCRLWGAISHFLDRGL